LILERLGCFDEAGLAKLRKGNAPTITKGPYAGEIVTGDHIIPRSVCPELDNKIYNLEMMPLTLNQRKGAKITQRQIDLLFQQEGFTNTWAVNSDSAKHCEGLRGFRDACCCQLRLQKGAGADSPLS